MPEVEKLVRWMKYHPEGSADCSSEVEAEFGAKPAPQHVADSNRDRWTVIQIETARRWSAIEGIAAVEGVDCLFVEDERFVE